MGNARDFATALVTIDYEGRYWEKIEDALRPSRIIRCAPGDGAAIAEAVREAEVAILAGDVSDAILREGKKLKWVHCNHAGINNSARPEIFERGIALTSSAGRSGPVLAEHAFYLLLSLVYNSRLVERRQRERAWGNIYADSRGLYGKTMGIVGLGFTGREVAARAKAFGMTVLAYDRAFPQPPECVDRAYDASKGDGCDELLQESDAVVLAVRLSDATFHMIDRRALSLMKKTALLVNMARGAVVDEPALAEALKAGAIAGAGSDVFESEPLPADSPLWDLPNMIITPHCTPEMPDMPGNCVEIICGNIRAFREGGAMLNAVDVRDVYTKGLQRKG
jgi:phosphoglycerate dehydrogenase-like enzyme